MNIRERKFISFTDTILGMLSINKNLKVSPVWFVNEVLKTGTASQ